MGCVDGCGFGLKSSLRRVHGNTDSEGFHGFMADISRRCRPLSVQSTEIRVEFRDDSASGGRDCVAPSGLQKPGCRNPRPRLLRSSSCGGLPWATLFCPVGAPVAAARHGRMRLLDEGLRVLERPPLFDLGAASLPPPNRGLRALDEPLIDCPPGPCHTFLRLRNPAVTGELDAEHTARKRRGAIREQGPLAWVRVSGGVPHGLCGAGAGKPQRGGEWCRSPLYTTRI